MNLTPFFVSLCYFIELVITQSCLQYSNSTTNLILNPDFQNTTCTNNYCVFYLPDYPAKSVINWYPDQ
jgi:hypothetical protein